MMNFVKILRADALNEIAKSENSGNFIAEKYNLNIDRLVNIQITSAKNETATNKNFSCSICDYTAPKQSKLAEHMTRHTKIFPYECKLCDYKTARKPDIRYHLTKVG